MRTKCMLLCLLQAQVYVSRLFFFLVSNKAEINLRVHVCTDIDLQINNTCMFLIIKMVGGYEVMKCNFKQFATIIVPICNSSDLKKINLW